MIARKIIEAVLVQVDPMGLIAMGAPVDEYEDEAWEIKNRLYDGVALAEIESLVCDVFESQFNDTEVNLAPDRTHPAWKEISMRLQRQMPMTEVEEQEHLDTLREENLEREKQIRRETLDEVVYLIQERQTLDGTVSVLFDDIIQDIESLRDQ